MKMLALATVVFAISGCAHRPAAPVAKVRFDNADPVWLTGDRHHVAVAPAERPEVRGGLRDFDIHVVRRLDRILDGRPHRFALGTNSLDEVPTSTWFENRIGVRKVSREELARGPGDGLGPDLSAPLIVRKGKEGGTVPGFLAEDGSGVSWLVKLDTPSRAGGAATDIAVQRLFWLIGYHVPENHIIFVDRDQLVVAADATFKDALGAKRPLTEDDVDAALALAEAEPDGRYRVLVSRLLDGTPIGGFPHEGVRPDDPNDRIPHERRRDLRGLYVFAAWLGHADMKEANTLDMWREDPVQPGRHVVFHYLLDFGSSLGLWTHESQEWAYAGHVERMIEPIFLRSLLSFGLWKRPWEGTTDPEIPWVGAFDVEHFDPGAFKPFAPFAPWEELDARDARWAVKTLLRITRRHIETALEQGRFSDSRAVEYLTEVLVGRQRKTAAYWLARVSPLDQFEVDGKDLCFLDLVEEHQLEQGAAAYRAEAFNWNGSSLGTLAVKDGCVRDLATGSERDDYTIVKVEVERGGRGPLAIEVHLARDPHGDLRVIGIEPRI